MHKQLSILILTALLIFSSCKKDYYCECKQGHVVTATKTYHDTRFLAKNKCRHLDQTYYETSCGLK